MKLKDLKIGLGVTGSFCNLKDMKEIIQMMKNEGAQTIIPVISYSIKEETNRFGDPTKNIGALEEFTNNKVIDTISKAEPIGPQNLIDIMVIAPCTGNTLAKLSSGVTDTPVLMATKSHLRNNKPVVLGIASNDALGANAKNIGELLNTKNIFFVPFKQDDYEKKPKSLVYDYTLLIDTIVLAIENKQIQPILIWSGELLGYIILFLIILFYI